MGRVILILEITLCFSRTWQQDIDQTIGHYYESLLTDNNHAQLPVLIRKRSMEC